MTTLNIDELTNPLTRQDVQAKVYEVLAHLGVQTSSWKPGAVVRTMIACTSVVLAALSRVQADIAKSGFLDLADGAWLTLVARHVYGVERIAQTFATGEVTLTNTGGGVYTLAAHELVLANEVTGQAYRNSTGFTLGASQTLTVSIIAVEGGAASSAAPEEVTVLSTPLPGVDASNTLGLTGLDEETDLALRARCRERLGALSPMGPWDAYAYAVKNATREDGSSLGITRVRLDKDGFGNVYVYCATQSGTVQPDDVAIAAEAVEHSAVPQCVTAHVASAAAKPVAVTYTAYCYNTSGMTPDEIKAVNAKAIAAFFAAQPVGGHVIGTANGKLFLNSLRAAIASALPGVTFHVTVSSPSTDVTLDIDDVVMLAGTPTATITLETPPEGYIA